MIPSLKMSIILNIDRYLDASVISLGELSDRGVHRHWLMLTNCLNEAGNHLERTPGKAGSKTKGVGTGAYCRVV